MYVTMRGLLAAALVGVVAIGGAIFLLNGKPNATVGASPTPGAVATSEPSSVAVRPIANGTYQASVAVADINARLQADANLTPDDRATIINSILPIAGTTTLNLEIAVDDDTFTGAYGADGGFTSAGAPWRLYVLDATTIALGDPTGRFGIQAWGVTRDGDGFSLRALSPATEPIETFVRSVLYEMAPFTPKP